MLPATPGFILETGRQTATLRTALGLQIPPGTSGNHQVGVRVANICDAGGAYSTKFFNVTCSGFAAVYNISPNPATNEVTISASEAADRNTTIRTITSVSIYDQQGTLKKSQKFGKVHKAVVNLTGLSTGVYFIEIVDGQNKVRQQLSILK